MVSNDFIFYLLSTARTSRGTNNLEMKVPNIFSIMFWQEPIRWAPGFDHQIHIECITAGADTS